MKKIILACVVLLLVLVAVPSAMAANSCGDGVTWSYTSSTYTLTISKTTGTGVMDDYGTVVVNGSTTTRTVPWSGKTIKKIVINSGVKVIGKEAFKGLTSLTQVMIPSTVTEIREWAFDGCSTLNNVTLPSGLTEISNRCFSNCSALTTINIPTGITSIGTGAFYCTPLSAIEIPSGVTKIRQNAFYATSIKTVTVPNTVTTLESCFGACQDLKSVILPSGMTEIPNGMFSGCSSLNSIQIPSGVTRIGDNAFYYCQKLYNLELPSGLTEIGANAFRDMAKSLFILPETVTTIGLNAFDRSNSPSKNVRVLIPDSVTSLPDHLLLNSQSSAIFLIHDGFPLENKIDTGVQILKADASIPLYTISDFGRMDTNIFYYMTATGKLVLSGSGEIPANKYINNTALTEVEIQGSNIKNIGASAFEGCSNLRSISMGGTAGTIGERAFYGCEKLSDVCFSSWTGTSSRIYASSIGSYSFYGCKALTQIDLQVSGAGEYAFAGCTGLEYASCYNTLVDSIPEGMFQGCTGLETVGLLKCGGIGQYAFDGCSSVNRVESGPSGGSYTGYTSIGAYAFRGCTALSWYFVPASVTTIAGSAFPAETVLMLQNGCNANTGSHAAMNMPSEVSMASYITSGGYCGTNAIYCITGYTNVAASTRRLKISGSGTINSNAFDNNKTFNRLVIDEGITGIGNYAFRDTYCCEATLPASLRTIGAQAFRNCTGLDTLSWQSGLTTIGDYAFENNALSTIELPETVESVGNYAFYKTGATSVIIIPGSVKTIGNYAFTNGSNTSTIVIYSKDSSYIPGAGYAGYNGGTANSITIPVESGISVNDLLEYGKCGTNAYYYVTSGKALYVTGTGAVQDYAFYYMDNSNMTGKVRVSTLGTQLTAVTIGEGITHVGEFCFRCDENIASVVLPESLQSMGREAFSGIRYLSSIQFPQHGFTAGDHLFYNAYSNLKSVTLPEGLISIPASMFSQCSNLTSVVIPSTIREIGSSAFNGAKLQELELPEGLRSIGYGAFYNMQATEVILPSTLTSLDPEAFYLCPNLRRIIFRGDVPEDALTVENGKAFRGITAEILVPHASPVWAEGKLEEGSAIRYYCPDDEEHMADFAAAISDPVEPTCTAEGYASYPYCADCGMIFTDVTASAQASQDDYAIPATGHSYVDGPVVAFAADGSACTAAFACEHEDYTLQVPMTVTSEVDTPAGCLTKGKTLYTATLEISGNETVDGETVSLPAGTYTETLLVEDIEALGHDPQPVASVEPTCTETGLTEGSICARCKEVLVSQSVIPATGHSYVDEPVLTFAADGSACTATFTCVHEDHSVTMQTEVGSEVAVPAKCLEKGKTLYTATLEIDKDVTVDGETVSLPAGMYTETLLVEDIDALGHDPQTVASVEATCTETGLTEGSVCARCKDVLDPQNVIPATGHSYGDEPVLTFTADGSACTATFTCVREDHSVTVQAEVSSEVSVPAKCLENGKTLYTATLEISGDVTVDGETVSLPDGTYTETMELEDIPAKGHKEGIISGFAPTCTKAGKKDYIFCEECDATIQSPDIIPALGHTDTVTIEAQDATCTEEGHTEEHTCSVCHTVLKASQKIPATGHCYGEPVFRWSEDGTACQVSFVCEKEDDTQTMAAEVTSELTMDPSCTEAGSKVYTATVEFGGKEYSEAGEPMDVPATGHTPVVDAAVAPTDRESGLTEGSHCGVCGEPLKEQEVIPALWSYSEDGLTAIAYNGTASELTIPEGVTTLGDTLFKNNTSVKYINIPVYVTTVGSQTFSGTTGDILLPDDLLGIGYRTFYNTTACMHTGAGGSTARQISYYNNLPFQDGEWTLQFLQGTNLDEEPEEIYLLGWEGTDETLVIPESFGGVALKAIRANAFDGMSQMKKVTVPASVTVIADDAFDGCNEELTVVSAYDAYARTWALANEVKWEHDQHVPQAVEGVPATYTKPGLTEGSVCAECGKVLEEQEEIPALDTSTLKTLKLPTGLTEIEDEAFEKGAFEAVIIPDGCMHIGHKAFKECEQLVYVSYPTGAEFEEDAFDGCGVIEFAER